jgi:hypothetical protein
MITPYGRKVCGGKGKRRNKITNIVDTLLED